MSRKTATKPKPFASGDRRDRRISRTRNTLGDALIELMRDQPFDSITVQQVLDRARVSRSTFYTHYRDKDDLFLSDVEDFLELIGTLLTRRSAPARRLFPVEELFAHLTDLSGIAEVITKSGRGPEVRELGVGCFARSIEKRLLLAGVKMPRVELHATAHSLAGSIFSLLDWWMRNGKAITPKDMDAHFHRLAWGGLGTAPAVNQ
jgi:AcrR family transcriptional regulator